MSQYSTKYLKDYITPIYYISRTCLHFDIYDTHTIVKVQYSVHRSPEHPSEETLCLDGEHLELNSIHLDGCLLSDNEYECNDSELKIYKVPEKFILDIETKINPDQNKALAGLYRSKSILVTQCEPHGFRRITYGLDRPDVSSIYTTSITADASTYPVLLSNGDKQLEVDIDNNRKLVVWHDPHPKPSYLFALVAGDLACVSSSYTTLSSRKINLELYVEHGSENQCEFALEAVKKAMRWDEEKYSREYDLDIFMIVAAEDFNNGAMENKGLNIFNISCINTHEDLSTDSEFLRVASIVGHEYFHNWSGNRVTCRDWFQLSLKEGFTVYREHQFMEDTFPVSLNRIDVVNKLISYQFTEDESPLAHAVQPDSYMEVNNFYTTTVYEKGAEVIRMLQILIGDENYFKGSSNYFAKFDGSCATIKDFVACMEESSGHDLSQFKNWYKQKGTPTIEVKTDYNDQNATLDIGITQKAPTNDENVSLYPLVIPIEIALFSKEGDEIEASQGSAKSFEHLLVLDKEAQTYHFTDVNAEPTVSLLRGLSAPIKMKCDYSTDDLHILMVHEKDQYNRWNAATRLHKRELSNVLKSISEGSEPAVSAKYLDIIEDLLSKADDQSQYSILGNLLQLPKLKIFIQELTSINIEHVFKAYQFTQSTIYHKHNGIINELFDKLRATRFDSEGLKVKRILQHSLLNYISADNTEKEANFLSDLLSETDNITEQLSIMSHLCVIDSQFTEKKLNYFHEKWKDNPLTYEKWLRLLSGSNTKDICNKIKQVKQNNSRFSSTNPNHVRALFGNFSMENLLHFHTLDGHGYQLVIDEILEIDKFNPQLSSRLVSTFAIWQKFAKENQTLMSEKLQTIVATEKISKNLFEMTEKMLS